MSCCADPSECDNGPGCQAGADTVPPPPQRALPRTCEALGVCQRPTRECPGACEQIPALPFWTIPEPWAATAEPRSWSNVLVLVVLAGCSIGVVYGAILWVTDYWPPLW